MTRILNVEPADYAPEARAVLQGLGALEERPMEREELLASIAGFDVLITRLAHRVDAEVLAAADDLRFIVTATTGLDHIDLDAAARQGVEVLSLRGEQAFLRSITSTAEHTWGLLLALVRRIPWAARAVESGAWDRDAFRGNELSGKRLAVLGVGRVGAQVAAYGRAFGMQVVGFDPSPRWPEGIVRANDVGDLVAGADVLTVHVSLPGGAGVVGAAELRGLAPGAVLINTSRGAAVDEAALLDALGSGRLAGAALDVVAGELDTGPSAGLLEYARAHGNLLVTPHIGGATVEAMAKTELFMANKLAAALGAI